MIQTAVLYFPKKHFSPRFGDKFFTYDLTDYRNDDTNDIYCCGNQATFYSIMVSCGKDSWIVKRRYSEFVKLRVSIIQGILGHNIEMNNNIDRIVHKDSVVLDKTDLPSLPPKTLLSIMNDDNALDQRKKELDVFLDKLLSYLSSNNLLQLKCLRQFLGMIDDSEDTFED